MEFLTSYYWRQGEGSEGGTSLILRQGTLREIPLAFACLCTDSQGGRETDYITGQLLEWYRMNSGAFVSRRGGVKIERMREKLRNALERIEDEFYSEGKKQGGREKRQNSDLSGILCAGGSFLLFFRGTHRIYLANTRFLRPHLKPKAAGECGGRDRELHMESGRMEPGIGVLLATATFYGCLAEKDLAQCLEADRLRSQIQLDKRLEELGREAEKNAPSETGREGLGAVLLSVRREAE